MTLNELTTQYKAQTDNIKTAEATLERVKKERGETAKAILDLQGKTPFQYEGKEVVAVNMRGAFFLRPKRTAAQPPA
jgi:hypothetical protein